MMSAIFIRREMLSRLASANLSKIKRIVSCSSGMTTCSRTLTLRRVYPLNRGIVRHVNKHYGAFSGFECDSHRGEDSGKIFAFAEHRCLSGKLCCNLVVRRPRKWRAMRFTCKLSLTLCAAEKNVRAFETYFGRTSSRNTKPNRPTVSTMPMEIMIKTNPLPWPADIERQPAAPISP